MVIERILGEGIIVKLQKFYAYINDEKNGQVFFPIGVTSHKCNDLHELFAANESVVYTARKQVPAQNGCDFKATSVCKKTELITVRTSIKEMCKEWAYADEPKYGKIFIPYSARDKLGNEWKGHDGVKGVKCTLQILEQAETYQCSYIAFEIFIDNSLPSATKVSNLKDIANIPSYELVTHEAKDDFTPKCDFLQCSQNHIANNFDKARSSMVQKVADNDHLSNFDSVSFPIWTLPKLTYNEWNNQTEKKIDAETQTDEPYSEEILRDILNQTDILKALVQAFQDHVKPNLSQHV